MPFSKIYTFYMFVLILFVLWALLGSSCPKMLLVSLLSLSCSHETRWLVFKSLHSLRKGSVWAIWLLRVTYYAAFFCNYSILIFLWPQIFTLDLCMYPHIISDVQYTNSDTVVNHRKFHVFFPNKRTKKLLPFCDEVVPCLWLSHTFSCAYI